MRMKNSAGAKCVMQYLKSREGFHGVCSIDDSASEYLLSSLVSPFVTGA